MPIYEYKCKKCNSIIEKLQKINDKSPKCEKCNSKMKKLPSKNDFHLKGEAWAAKNGY